MEKDPGTLPNPGEGQGIQKPEIPNEQLGQQPVEEVHRGVKTPELTDKEIVVLAFSYSVVGKRRTNQLLSQMLGLTSKQISAIRESGMQKLVHHYLQGLPDERVKGLPVNFYSLPKTQEHGFRGNIPKAIQTWDDLIRT